MGSLSANSESGVSPVSPNSISPVADSQTPNFKISNLDSETLDLTFSKMGYEFKQKEGGYSLRKNGSLQRSDKKTHTKKKKKKVFLEGYDDDDLTRTKSLTDEDLNELKGCVDLGFGFSYNEIPELCNTLPALELCYSLSQKFLDEQQKLIPDASEGGGSSPSVFISSWKISSPGDQPEEVKARLKFWAQAVACTVKLCS